MSGSRGLMIEVVERLDHNELCSIGLLGNRACIRRSYGRILLAGVI